MSMRSFALAFPAVFIAQLASAQVLITELQPSPVGADNQGEWIELQNSGTSSVSIEGWTLNDYAGTNESTTRWAFPMGAAIQPGQVVLVALNAGGFNMNYPMAHADYELASGSDDPAVLNLSPDTGTNLIALGTGMGGDAVLLRDEMGNVVAGMEYGTDRATIPGTPASGTIGEGDSFIRINNTGSSFTDFFVTAMPEPGVGFVAAEGPVLADIQVEPRHTDYGRNMSFSLTATDTDGLSEIDVFVAIATSSTADAQMNYTQITMTSTNGVNYHYAAMPGALDPVITFADPPTFHSNYVRWYFYAQDLIGTETKFPPEAEESASNSAYDQKNVMPTSPSPIVDLVATNADLSAKWAGHSAKITGVVTAQQGVFNTSTLNFNIEDDSGRGIRIFSGGEPTDNDVYRVGDRVGAVGTISQFNGVMQLALENHEVVEKLGTGGSVATTTVTIAELIDRAEELESRLVHIVNVNFDGTAPATWPDDVRDGVVIKDDSNMTIEIVMNADNELAGMPVPQHGFDLTAAVSQFSNNNRGGYELFPRTAADINAHPAPIVDAGVQADAGGGGGADAGRSDAGVSGGTDAGSGPGGAEDEGGCSCDSTSSPFESLAGLALLIAGLVLLRRRS